MCYVRFVAVEYVWRIRSTRNILWRSKRFLMLLYTCFRFSEVMFQMFLTVQGAVQGSFRATLGVASVFVHVVLRPGWGAWRCPPPPPTPRCFFSGGNLDYLDFFGGIFDL